MLQNLLRRFAGQTAPSDAAGADADVAALNPGDHHYRAYVGPVERFGPVSLLQFSLMTALGLDENDRVLDFGCGSLRLGRLLMPFLRPGLYHGIDPNTWLMEEGLRREAGMDIKTLKRPAFSGDGSFNCDVFGVPFDFIMAQSIITHSGAEDTERFLASAARALADDGVVMLSYFQNAAGDDSLPMEKWTYPGCVSYPLDWLNMVCSAYGLIWRDVDWYHPGARWALVAKDERRLPPAGQPLYTNGHPMERWRAGS